MMSSKAKESEVYASVSGWLSAAEEAHFHFWRAISAVTILPPKQPVYISSSFTLPNQKMLHYHIASALRARHSDLFLTPCRQKTTHHISTTNHAELLNSGRRKETKFLRSLLWMQTSDASIFKKSACKCSLSQQCLQHCPDSISKY